MVTKGHRRCTQLKVHHGKEFRALQNTLGQYFGLGSETRKTDTWVPDPYGIEVGNPIEIPDGYEERWMLNVHAIDTRDVKDRLGCTECKCSLYNVTENEFGQPLASGYVGGLHCCYDKTQCRVKEENMGDLRKLYLKYIVKWVDWDPSIVPVKIYILDVTDTGDHPSSSSAVQALSNCKVEYIVLPCDSTGKNKEDCVDVKKTNIILPRGGEIVYGVYTPAYRWYRFSFIWRGWSVAVLLHSILWQGTKAGDEEGYIVGMSTCYPKPSTVK
ncbi:hypothetical protein HPP92_025301 [Vanilla planifolia]|uniref:Uncharacterized protein n=1 Tax=Vanilla planifolia TaxID=51239 RepID=A0A835PM10_VANPL|nr:hypothetical protein HPP92_025301 [Vanilla planifolia]